MAKLSKKFKVKISGDKRPRIYTIKENEALEMIEEIDMYWCADNVPKWIFVKSGCKLTKRKVINVIKKALETGETLDLRY